MNKALYFTILGIILILVVGAFGFWLGTTQGGRDIAQTAEVSIEETQEEIADVTEEYEFITLAEQNDSGETGLTFLREDNGQVNVTLRLIGTPEFTQQPAHIHSGSCSNLGGVVHSLTPVTDGESQTNISTSMAELRAQESLAINVHQSEEEFNVYVACGNLFE